MKLDNYADCTKCEKLYKRRKNIVWGDGPVRSPILFVGEAPGAVEDEKGRPFVGPAGEQHWSMIERAEIPRQWVYNTNAVLCRPTDYKDPLGNRAPVTEEIKNCRPRLYHEILLVDPLIIVALGKVAYYAITGKGASIKHVMGDIHDVEIITPHGCGRFPVLALLHPSYIMQHATDTEVQRQFDYLKFLKKIVDFMLKD